MPPTVVLYLNLVVALALVVVGLRPPSRGRLLLVGAPLLDAIALVTFVFGEDSYRDTGISRWNAYRSPGGALGPMFVVSVVLLLVGAALLGYSERRARRTMFRGTAAVTGLVALLLVTPTIIGFNNN